MIVYQCIGEPPEDYDNEWIYDDKVFVSEASAKERLEVLKKEHNDPDDEFYYFFLIHLELVE